MSNLLNWYMAASAFADGGKVDKAAEEGEKAVKSQ